MRTAQTDTNNYSGPMRAAGLVGIAAAILGVIGLFISGADAFFQAYLYSFLFWVGVSLGCLAILLLHFTVSSRWGLAIRRITEAGAGSICIMALLFIPLIFGLGSLYIWARPEAVAADALLQKKSFY